MFSNNNTSSTSAASLIDSLKNDELTYIMRLLSFADRIKVERVSRRWREISRNSWTDQKSMSVSAVHFGLKQFGECHEPFEIESPTLDAVLKRCGHFIRSINLCSDPDGKCFEVISRRCPNLTSIKCSYVSLSSFDFLIGKITHLRELSLNWVHDASKGRDDILKSFLARNQTLHSFELYRCHIYGECMSKLPLEKLEILKVDGTLTHGGTVIPEILTNSRCIRTLHLTDNEYVDNDVLSSLACCKNLTELKLYLFTAIDNVDDLLSDVFESNLSLKSLSLVHFPSLTGKCFSSLRNQSLEDFSLTGVTSIQDKYLNLYVENFLSVRVLELKSFENGIVSLIPSTESYSSFVSKLINLTKLVFNSIKLTDETLTLAILPLRNLEHLCIKANHNFAKLPTDFFRLIGNNLLSLETLSLSRFKNLSDEHFQFIKSLKFLHKLDISHNRNLTGRELISLSRLKELKCSGCINLTNENIVEFIRSADNLELLDLRLCKKISCKVIREALKTSRERVNGIKLTLKTNLNLTLEYKEFQNRMPTFSLENEEFTDEGDTSSDSD